MRKKFFGSKLGPKPGNALIIGSGPPATPGGKPFDADEPNLHPDKEGSKLAKDKYPTKTARGAGVATKGMKYKELN